MAPLKQNMHGKIYFRSFWPAWIRFTPAFGLFLILLFGVPRFILVLGANAGGGYSNISVLFLSMWVVPFLLLNKNGLTLIGLQRPVRAKWWGISLFLGLLVCLIVYVTGFNLYGKGLSNWFVYISRSYSGAVPLDLEEHRTLVFLIFAGIGVTFSPIGEELLYRGLIHQCFVPSLGENKASIADSVAFALTHLAHFGFLFTGGKWEFRLVPAFLWVMLMYMTGRLFFYCRNRGGSLYMAMACHAGFNLAMNYFICFYLL